MAIVRAQSGVILKMARLLPWKGYLMFLTTTNWFYFFDILTHNMLNEIDKSVWYEFFSFNIFRTLFKLENDYFDVIIFCGVLTSPSNFTLCSYSNAHILTSTRDSCMNFSAFVHRSFMSLMQVFSWLGTYIEKDSWRYQSSQTGGIMWVGGCHSADCAVSEHRPLQQPHTQHAHNKHGELRLGYNGIQEATRQNYKAKVILDDIHVYWTLSKCKK